MPVQESALCWVPVLPYSCRSGRPDLVIIDEEHENTYKQFDPAPRYHARDTAIMLARFHGAKVLLGTATPSVETYFNCADRQIFAG